jgi:uncharacterized membrane protein
MFHKNVEVKAHFDRNSIEMSELIGGLVLLGPIA